MFETYTITITTVTAITTQPLYSYLFWKQFSKVSARTQYFHLIYLVIVENLKSCIDSRENIVTSRISFLYGEVPLVEGIFSRSSANSE